MYRTPRLKHVVASAAAAAVCLATVMVGPADAASGGCHKSPDAPECNQGFTAISPDFVGSPFSEPKATDSCTTKIAHKFAQNLMFGFSFDPADLAIAMTEAVLDTPECWN